MPDIDHAVWVKAPIVIEEQLWHAFHAACLTHGTNASAEVQAFMHAMLATWAHVDAAMRP